MKRLTVFLFLASLALHAHGDLHDQIGRVTAQILKDQDNLELYLKRGELYRLHQEFEAAEMDFARAASLPGVHFHRGRLYADRKLWPAALQSLKLAQESETALALRAEVYGQLGQPRNAARDWRRAIDVAAEPKVEYYLGLAAALDQDHRHAAAIQAIDEGAGKLGPLWTLEQWAIESEASAARWSESLARLDRLIAVSARKEALLARKAELERQAGRPTAARASAEAARQAWNQLPERIRQTKAMVELDTRLTALLGPG